MTETTLYLRLEKNFNRTDLARMEICWLIKDALGLNETPKTQQKGFSFVRAQIQPIKSEDALKLKNRIGIEVATRTILKTILKHPLPLRTIKNRVASADLIVQESNNSFDFIDVDDEFWVKSQLNYLPSFERAMLNIAHPYHQGAILIEPLNRIVKYDSLSNEILSIYLDYSSVENPETELIKSLSRNFNIIKAGSQVGQFRNNLKDLNLETGALSSMNVLVKIPQHQKDLEVKFVEICEKKDLAPHIHIELPTGVFLGFKPHPRDEEIKTPDFIKYDPGHELRRLDAVEEVRNMLHGHKGPYGSCREKICHKRNGWEIYITRPGFKDCEDFIVDIISPDKDSDIHYSSKPSETPFFKQIFEEINKYLSDPKSRDSFLQTIHDLWWETKPHRDIIRNHNIPKVEGTLYDTDAFLYLLYYVFIVEDMNYRFFYHPVRMGVKKRKQGRDRPYTVILRLAANEDLDLATELGMGSGVIPLLSVQTRWEDF